MVLRVIRINRAAITRVSLSWMARRRLTYDPKTLESSSYMEQGQASVLLTRFRRRFSHILYTS